MTDFRSAIGIELYDACAKIQVEDTDFSAFNEINFNRLKLDSNCYFNEEGINNLSKITSFYPRTIQSFLAGLETLEIHKPFSFYLEDFRSEKISNLLIRVVASNLVEIKVHVTDKDSSDVHIHEFTYSGTFSIEWDTWTTEQTLDKQ